MLQFENEEENLPELVVPSERRKQCDTTEVIEIASPIATSTQSGYDLHQNEYTMDYTNSTPSDDPLEVEDDEEGIFVFMKFLYIFRYSRTFGNLPFWTWLH